MSADPLFPDAVETLPPLREVIRRHGLSARKSLGQNFLLDLNLTRRIARAVPDLEHSTVLEIGPGPGGLTRALLLEGAQRVIAIERDVRCLGALSDLQAVTGRLEVIEGDALKVNYPALVPSPDTPVCIVANLPYNIATPLLLSWVATPHWPPFYHSLTLMFQKEVAQRIVATPGDAAYGRLSVLCGWRMRGRLLFDVAASNFVPPPKVTSSIVQLVPRTDPLPCPLIALERVTQAAFGQRRKMLRSSLRSLNVESGVLLQRAGISDSLRAEEIDVQGFVALAHAYSEMASS